MDEKKILDTATRKVLEEKFGQNFNPDFLKNSDIFGDLLVQILRAKYNGTLHAYINDFSPRHQITFVSEDFNLSKFKK